MSKLHEQALLLVPEKHQMTDAGPPLPPELVDLDVFTPFGTLLRYEDLGSAEHLDREGAARKVRALHALVTQRVR